MDSSNLFDLVYFIGLIEHFNDIENIIFKHTLFLNEKGMLLIVIPNFRGVNGWVQKKFDKANYDIHNIECMDIEFLRKIALKLNLKEIEVSYFGGFSVWLENKESIGFFKKLY